MFIFSKLKKQLQQTQEELQAEKQENNHNKQALSDAKQHIAQLEQELQDSRNKQKTCTGIFSTFQVFGKSLNDFQDSLQTMAMELKKEKETAIKAAEVSTQTQNNITVIANSLHKMSQDTGKNSEAVKGLNKHADEIGSFVKVISDISEQTMRFSVGKSEDAIIEEDTNFFAELLTATLPKDKQDPMYAIISERIEKIRTAESEKELKEIKTALMAEAMKKLKIKGKTLMTFDEKNRKYMRASRNLPEINNLEVERLNVFDILNNKNVIITEAGLKFLEKKYK